ncbi:MAG: hypothetical protein IPO41_09020 [Acidobacteria bacterium]|nr:hypothetical protein [Acidobacteriota bacterium]
MAEALDDDFKAEMLDFKAQMLRFVKVTEQKFDGLASDVRDNSFRIDKVEQKLGQRIDDLDRKLSAKLDQVAEKVVDHEKRLRSIESDATTSPTIN